MKKYSVNLAKIQNELDTLKSSGYMVTDSRTYDLDNYLYYCYELEKDDVRVECYHRISKWIGKRDGFYEMFSKYINWKVVQEQTFHNGYRKFDKFFAKLKNN